MRKLPDNVIHETMLNSYEPNEMAKRFGNPDYKIQNGDGDQIAFSYMNIDAKLFWLPKIIQFIKTEPFDGFIEQHIETIIYDLSDKSWFNLAKSKMTESERKEVADFLKWLNENITDSKNDPDIVYATYLWKIQND